MILHITAHSITVRGERPSSTYPHLAAWPQLTGWYLCYKPSFRPCSTSWRTLQNQHEGRPSSLKKLVGQEIKYSKQQRLFSFIYSKFQKKRKYKRFLDTHFETACQKIRNSAIGVKKLLRPQIQSMKEDRLVIFLKYFFPNQVMNTDFFESIIIQ